MRLIRTAVVFALVASLAPGSVPAHDDHGPGNRIVVSTTLNDGLLVFDSRSLEEEQGVISKGGGPIRLAVHRVGGRPFLFAANHGAPQGSVGVFALDAHPSLLVELPASPFPARPGTVGVAAADVTTASGTTPMVFSTNTWHALGTCAMPAGSVTAFDASLLGTAGVMAEIGSVELTGSIPYAVSVDGAGARAFASVNCGDTLETIQVSENPLVAWDAPVPQRFTLERSAVRPTGRGPDGTLFDDARGLVYTTNIDGNSLSVHDASTPGEATRVPLPGTGPIEAELAEGTPWILTANGADDTISVIDRDIIVTCISAGAASCRAAEVLRIPTGVPGGAPEGIAYDPLTRRVFVVNKPIGSPSLTVIQLGDGPSGEAIATIPLPALTGAPVPAIIAFDVAVAPRA